MYRKRNNISNYDSVKNLFIDYFLKKLHKKPFDRMRKANILFASGKYLQFRYFHNFCTTLPLASMKIIFINIG